MANLLLEAALTYREQGFHPIPCAPRDKRPLVPWKDFQTTMPTVDQVRVWWTRTPDANVALVLGRGIFAVDLDGGDDAEALLAAEGIALPVEAPRSRTGGGYHVFLSAWVPIPDRVGLLSTDGGKPQVDIRGIGIVVAPPSIHPNGRTYEWMTPLAGKPPNAPLALTDLIARAAAPVTAATTERRATGDRFWVADALRGVGAGMRDQTCTRLAGFFLKKGIDPDTVVSLLSESFARSCDPPFDPRDVEKCVRSIARRHAVDEDIDRGVLPKHIGAVLDEFLASMEAGPAPTLPTPFPTLNYFLNGGFGPGELIFLGARPGVGKTALGLEFARKAAMRREGAVIVVSREMTNLALARRLVAQDGRVRASVIKRADLDDHERWMVSQSVDRLRGLPLFFADDAVSLTEIQTVIAATASEAPLSFLIVDYLQLVRAPKEIKERRHQVEAVSQGLKTMALQYRIPVLCLSSLSRPSNEDKNKPPTLASLRESGELEHDADVILLLHRGYHDEETGCHVAKNRDGRLGQVHLLFRQEYVAFDEAAAQGDN